MARHGTADVVPHAVMQRSVLGYEHSIQRNARSRGALTERPSYFSERHAPLNQIRRLVFGIERAGGVPTAELVAHAGRSSRHYVIAVPRGVVTRGNISAVGRFVRHGVVKLSPACIKIGIHIKVRGVHARLVRHGATLRQRPAVETPTCARQGVHASRGGKSRGGACRISRRAVGSVGLVSNVACIDPVAAGHFVGDGGLARPQGRVDYALLPDSGQGVGK